MSIGVWTETSSNPKTGGIHSVNYDSLSWEYMAEKTFHVTGCSVEAIALELPYDPLDPPDTELTYPEYMSIAHNGLDIDGNTYCQYVHCYVAEKPSVLVSPTQSGVVEVRIQYKGRVCGFVGLLPSKQDRTVTQFWDLTPVVDEDGSITGTAGGVYHPAIGVDFQGVEIHAPILYVALQVIVPMSAIYNDVLDSIESVTPYGNENNWIPPWTLMGCAEGDWLCVGYSNVNTDVITRTAEFLVVFEYDTLKPYGQHLYQWRKALDTHTGVNLMRSYEGGDPIESQVNELAGQPNLRTSTKVPFDGGDNPTFVTAINNCFMFNSLVGPSVPLTPQRILVR